MSDLQDSWLRSPQEFPVCPVTAVLIRIFSLHHADLAEDWRRAAADWLSIVGSPEEECLLLCPRLTAEAVNRAAKNSCSIVSKTAESWETRTITDPSTETVVSDLLNQLADDGVVTLYYG